MRWDDQSRRLLASGRGHLHVPRRRLSLADRVRSWVTDDLNGMFIVLVGLALVVAVGTGRC